MVGGVRHYLEAYKLPREGREPGARTARQYGSCMCMCMRCASAVKLCVVCWSCQSTWTAKRPWFIPVHIRPAFPHQARFLCNRRLRRHYASHCARCILRVQKRRGNKPLSTKRISSHVSLDTFRSKHLKHVHGYDMFLHQSKIVQQLTEWVYLWINSVPRKTPINHAIHGSKTSSTST